MYPWEGNALDDVAFQKWLEYYSERDAIIHEHVALGLMFLERKPPYEIDIITGRDA